MSTQKKWNLRPLSINKNKYSFIVVQKFTLVGLQTVPTLSALILKLIKLYKTVLPIIHRCADSSKIKGILVGCCSLKQIIQLVYTFLFLV